MGYLRTQRVESLNAVISQSTAKRRSVVLPSSLVLKFIRDYPKLDNFLGIWIILPVYIFWILLVVQLET